MERQRELTQLCINTIRLLGADQPQAANSGHPGAPMGMAPMAHLLWTKVMNYSPSNPNWPNRDRFVLSNGHACALLYAMLHLAGYDVTLDDLKSFRALGSKTPGHPEANHGTCGVEVSTGPLGQGLSNAVGMAVGEKHLAAIFNKPGFDLVDHYTFVFCGDGCLQEGVTSEASSLAGHLGLGKLIVLYDDNHVTIDGNTDLSFTEDVLKRYESYGWHVQVVADGDNDLEGLLKAVEEAKKETERPSLIKVHTTIGFGSKKSGTADVHGSPLGEEDLAAVKTKLGFDPAKKFFIPPEVQKVYATQVAKGKELEHAWNELLEKYKAAYPEQAAEFTRRVLDKALPKDWAEGLPGSTPEGPALATRQTSQAVISALAERLPELFGGSADLNPSCLTYLKASKDFQKNSPEGRNLRFGVREHAMAAICNGLAAYGGFLPFCSTFLNFIGYALGAVTLGSLTGLQVLYVMTHDSIGLGEDGPTHQPVEKYAVCRATPKLLFFRPCDGNETAGSYIAAIRYKNGPSVLSLTRQAVPPQKGTSIEGTLKGAYTIRDPEGKPDVILVSTGSEVHLCTQAADKLSHLKVRVVSMPSWELFEQQSHEYQLSVLLPGVPVLSVEAGTTLGWSRYSHAQIGLDRFGLSGPAKAVFAKLGFTPENVVEKAEKLVAFYSKNPVPLLLQNPLEL